nr:hypothetical protein [Tanacetum cinerariifolium]
MNIFAFIHTPDPTNVKIVERERNEGEPMLLETIIGRSVPLLPVVPDLAESEPDASVESLFDEGGSGNQTEQGDSVGGGKDANIQSVIEVADTVVEDVAPVQPKHQGKRKSVIVDAGGASHPPKELREDHGTPSGPLHFFWVDDFACPASFSWHTANHVIRDPAPAASDFNKQDYATLVAYPSLFWKFPEAFLCLVGLSRHYTLDEETYPWYLYKNREEMNIFAFIHTPDPTIVKIVERERNEGEPMLLETIIGRSVPLLPVVPDLAEIGGDLVLGISALTVVLFLRPVRFS